MFECSNVLFVFWGVFCGFFAQVCVVLLQPGRRPILPLRLSPRFRRSGLWRLRESGVRWLPDVLPGSTLRPGHVCRPPQSRPREVGAVQRLSSLQGRATALLSVQEDWLPKTEIGFLGGEPPATRLVHSNCCTEQLNRLGLSGCRVVGVWTCAMSVTLYTMTVHSAGHGMLRNAAFVKFGVSCHLPKYSRGLLFWILGCERVRAVRFAIPGPAVEPPVPRNVRERETAGGWSLAGPGMTMAFPMIALCPVKERQLRSSRSLIDWRDGQSPPEVSSGRCSPSGSPF